MASALWPVLGFVELVALAGVLALQFLGMFSGRAVQAGGVGAVSFATAVGQVQISVCSSAKAGLAPLWQDALLMPTSLIFVSIS